MVSDVEISIKLRKNERALWDVTFPKYYNVDVRRGTYVYTHTHTSTILSAEGIASSWHIVPRELTAAGSDNAMT